MGRDFENAEGGYRSWEMQLCFRALLSRKAGHRAFSVDLLQ